MRGGAYLCESCRTPIEPDVIGTVRARPRIDLRDDASPAATQIDVCEREDGSVEGRQYFFHERCFPHTGRWAGHPIQRVDHRRR